MSGEEVDGGPSELLMIFHELFETCFHDVIFVFSYHFIFLHQSRDRRQMNDPMGATNHASTARALNIAATIIALLAILITIIVVIGAGTATVQ
uniref:Uncharacterized protein n=1 Tax=Eptatretus burgeri TaxID=7764 RepID=A0A8C4WW34_EPTBU